MRTQQQDVYSQSPTTPRPESQGLQREAWSAPGQIVMGPSFYVWDESPKQAREWGVELANAWLAHRR
ncbi:MAG: hypothetical protein E6J87_00545 [Deltaproteobacteria bacterium]|nr:MAG: hypothetical protein E6J87_00545 [Deltaproteobacteria bacterium]